MATTRNQIQDFADLEDDWDGLGSAAPGSDIILLTLKLITFLNDAIPFTRAVPTSSGGILIEWQLSSGVYLEAEILGGYQGGDRIEWMIQEKENEYIHFTWSHSNSWYHIPLLYPGEK